MTNRDYANRKPKKGGKPRQGRKPQAPARRLPVFLLLFVVAAVAGFGYFLWSIKDSSQTAAPVKAEVSKPKAQKKDPNALPPKPKEEWSYLEELENKQVEVDLPKADSKPKRPYQMQCGSFRKESQANQMKAVIAFQGLEAQVRKVNGSKGIWYKVVLGPFDRKREAERQRHILQRGGMNGCQIWFWEG